MSPALAGRFPTTAPPGKSQYPFSEAQKFKVLMSSLPIFSFIAHVFGVIFKKPLPNPRPCRFISMLSSKSLIVSALIFKFLSILS